MTTTKARFREHSHKLIEIAGNLVRKGSYLEAGVLREIADHLKDATKIPEPVDREDNVRAFMLGTEQAMPATPRWPDKGTIELRVNLIEEEVEELLEALHERDLVEVADALGDILYVVYGTFAAMGMRAGPIFDAIHTSNMTKLIDGSFREDGKYLKGPAYVEPFIRDAFIEQGARAEDLSGGRAPDFPRPFTKREAALVAKHGELETFTEGFEAGIEYCGSDWDEEQHRPAARKYWDRREFVMSASIIENTEENGSGPRNEICDYSTTALRLELDRRGRPVPERRWEFEGQPVRTEAAIEAGLKDRKQATAFELKRNYKMHSFIEVEQGTFRLSMRFGPGWVQWHAVRTTWPFVEATEQGLPQVLMSVTTAWESYGREGTSLSTQQNQALAAAHAGQEKG